MQRPTTLLGQLGVISLLSACGQSETSDGASNAAGAAAADAAAEAQTEAAAADASPGPLSGTQTTTDAPDPVVATVIGSDGNEIGSLVVNRVRQGVRLDLHVEGLTPGVHAVHLHQTGACEPPHFASAGGHYDPAGASHGMPDADEDLRDPDHHAGDMLNQTADDLGMLDVQMVNQSVSVDGANGLLDDDGSALVVHRGADDYTTQPAGAAGPPVACAAITAQG